MDMIETIIAGVVSALMSTAIQSLFAWLRNKVFK